MSSIKIISYRKFTLVLMLTLLALGSYGEGFSLLPYALKTNLGKGVIEGTSKTKYELSTGYYDEDGVAVDFNETDAFSRLESEIVLGYGLSSSFDIFVGANYRQNSSTSATNGSTISITTGGIEALSLEGRYGLKRGDFRFLFSAGGKFSLYEPAFYPTGTTPPNDELVLGDGGHELTFKTDITYQTTNYHFLSMMVGYNLAPTPLSSEMIFSLESPLIIKSRVALVPGIKGRLSLNQSEYSENPTKRPMTPRGSTHFYNSVNRQEILPYMGISWNMGSFRAQVAYAQTVMGRSVDTYSEYLFSLTYNNSNKRALGVKEERFKEYVQEGEITKVSPKGSFIKINLGAKDSVEKGMKVDIYKADHLGNNVLIATARVQESGADWSIVKIEKLYKSIPLQVGFVVRVQND